MANSVLKFFLAALDWLREMLRSCLGEAKKFMAMFLRWITLAVLGICFMMLACLIAPILPAFAIGNSTLPRWLRWFQTPDNPLDGDQNFIDNVAPYPGKQTGLRQYINRVLWLWRNPAYGFDLEVLGFTAHEGAILVMAGTLPMNVTPRTGWYFAILTNPDGTRAWQFYAVKRWGTWASRVNFGWKLWSVPGRCQIAVTIQPYLSIPTT
ncbi:DUF7338 family protein [Caballeronia sp. HLA56]